MLKDTGAKLPADKKKAVEDAVAAVKEALKGSDASALRAANERLNQAWQSASEELYRSGAQAAGAAGGPKGAGPAPGGDSAADAGPTKGNDTVIDAEIVDEKKK